MDDARHRYQIGERSSGTGSPASEMNDGNQKRKRGRPRKYPEGTRPPYKGRSSKPAAGTLGGMFSPADAYEAREDVSLPKERILPHGLLGFLRDDEPVVDEAKEAKKLDLAKRLGDTRWIQVIEDEQKRRTSSSNNRKEGPPDEQAEQQPDHWAKLAPYVLRRNMNPE